MFNIDWNRIIIWLLPTFLRTKFNVSFLNALARPLILLYNLFLNFRLDNIYLLEHTSQVFSIESLLNDYFDISLRRIYIIDTGGAAIILLYPDSDLKEIILQPDNVQNAIFLLYPDSSYFDSQFDFIVMIPYLLNNSEIYRMKSLINKFKLAGKRYDIRLI